VAVIVDEEVAVPDSAALWANRTFEAVWGRAYDFGVEHPAFAKPFARLVMRSDIDRFYERLNTAGSVPDGGAILDVPCGGGIGLRGLRPEQKVRYVAADISDVMLERARRRAAERGLTTVEFVEADITRMPFDDGEFDLIVCFNGLHILPDPAAAVREMARCLAPGGQLVGECVVSTEVRRTDLLIRLLRTIGVFGNPGTVGDVRSWLTAAGLRVRSLQTSGAIAHFDAERPLRATRAQPKNTSASE
jgi:SAM-dependent methyltransferase